MHWTARRCRAYLPVVLTREEIRAVLQHLDGVPRLMALLLYGWNAVACA
jgi:hypothetical protein